MTLQFPSYITESLDTDQSKDMQTDIIAQIDTVLSNNLANRILKYNLTIEVSNINNIQMDTIVVIMRRCV